MSQRTTLVIPDVHHPFQDEQAWQLALKIVRDVKIEQMVILGDFFDFYAASTFDKSPLRRQDLKWELDLGRKQLHKLIRYADCPVTYCEGNHEFRLERYLCQKAPELYGLISAKNLILQGTQNVQWVPYRHDVKIGKVIYTHDLGHAGVYAIRHTLAAAGTNIVFGHTHRGGTHYEGDTAGDRRFGMNCGWLGDLRQADYMHRIKMKDWQLGLGVVETDDKGLVWATFAPIVRYRCVVRGKEYRL